MRNLGGDLRFAFRMLFSQPGFSAVSILTLALGISVTTAMFSVIDTMYWRAFPGVPEPDRLVELETLAPDGSVVRSAWRDFRDYRDRLTPVASVVAHTETAFTLGLTDQAKPVAGELVSGNYFSVLGVKTAHGRLFTPQDTSDTPGANAVAVISHRLWAAEFASDPGILGRTIRVNRNNLTVIGVAAPEFRGAHTGMHCDIWVPLTMGVQLGSLEATTFQDATLRNIYMFARLAPGTSLAGASAALVPVAKGIAEADPVGHRGFSAIMEPMWRARLHGRAAFLRPMLVLMAVSLLVLLIVCANVANLLLARSVGRMQEFAVRSAMGASPWRLARQCTTETFLLCLGGAVVGLPLAFWITDAAILLFPKLARPNVVLIEMNLHVAAFVLGLCLATAIGSSAAAVVFVLRSGLSGRLREGGRSGSAGARSQRIRSVLVISEVALAQVVLIGAGLFYREFSSLSTMYPGFDRNGVLLVNFPLASAGYSVAELESFCVRLRERVEAAPGITSVSYADYAPLWSSDGAYLQATPEGFLPKNPEDVKVHRTSVAPGYFSLLQVPLLEGRDFTESDDRKSEPVMLVNQAFAVRYYRGESPVGRRVMLRKKWHRIIGLVRDHKYFSYSEPVRPHLYLPFRQSYQLGQHLVFFVRSKGDPAAAIGTLRAAAAAVDANATNFTAGALSEYNELLLMPLRLAASLLAALGVIAFLLAGVGLHGVVSYTVQQRTREIGIRMALGAEPREVLAEVARQGLVLSAAGVVVGIGLALVAMRLIAGLLTGITPFDPATFAVSSLFLLGVTAVASSVPALRATRIDPVAALHSD